MKFTAFAFAALVSGAAARKRITPEFMEAMNKPAIKKGQAKKINELNSGLMKASRRVQENDGQYNYDYQWGYNADQDMDGMADGYYVDGVYYAYEEAPFDMTSRAFKYSGCAAIKSYDTDRAYENGNPMVIDTFAVFRLCPADKCNEYSMTGCGKNYGEYAVEMKTYLSYVLGYYDDQYASYCEYCAACDYNVKKQATSTSNQCYAGVETLSSIVENMNLNNNNGQGNNGQGNGWSWSNWGWGGNNNNNNNNAGGNRKLEQEAAGDDANDADGASGYYDQDGNWVDGENDQNVNGYFDQDGNWVQGNQNANGANGYYDQNGNWVQANNGDACANVQVDNNNMADGYVDATGTFIAAADMPGQLGYWDEYGNFVLSGEESVGYALDQNGMSGFHGSCGEWISGVNAAGTIGFFSAYGEFVVRSDTQLYNCVAGSCDFCQYEVEQLLGYCDEYTCGEYNTYCDVNYYGYYDSSQQAQAEFDPLDFLECTEWENQYGDVYFIAPHCGDDHYTISLGVFSDENCIDYIGEDVSLKTVLGFNIDDEKVLKVPKECVACDAAEEYERMQEEQQQYQQQYQQDQQDQQNGNQQQYQNQYLYYQYNQEQQQQQQDEQQQQQEQEANAAYYQYMYPSSTDGGVSAMCMALYSGSAQCNMNMNNFEYISRFMSQYELDQESRYCTFIENIIYGAYDESGEILLNSDTFDFSDWRNPKQYKKVRMPASQAIGLALSVILCVALLAVAAVTNRSLTRSSSPWKPERSDVSVSRQSSGIVLGRSRSGPGGTAPLI